MNRRGRVKEEVQSQTSNSSFSVTPPPAMNHPRPIEGLNETTPPPFLTKTYEIIEDTATNEIVSWSQGNNSFVVWDPQSFAFTLLPKYFKHNNFSSFVRQLNTYGFKKVDPDKWEFAHEGFLRGQKHLLKLIRRRKKIQPNNNNSQQSPICPDPCVEVGRFGLNGEVNRLRRDKQVLMVELVKLRQQQQNTKTYLQTMEDRLKRTESKQQTMMNFLARAMQNPDFIHHIIQQKERHKQLEEVIKKKKRRHIAQAVEDHQPSEDYFSEHGEVVEEEEKDSFVKIEPESIYGDMEMNEELLGVEMQEYPEEESTVKGEEMDEIQITMESCIDEGLFWEKLLNDANANANEGVLGINGFEDDDEQEENDHEEDADDLVHQLGLISTSNPK